MSRYRCYEQDVEAPRVGCACHECYKVREGSLDPRLLELAYQPPMGVRIQVSREVLRRCLIEYCAGRVDYGALYVGIIKALMELADKHVQQALNFASIQMPAVMFPLDIKNCGSG